MTIALLPIIVLMIASACSAQARAPAQHSEFWAFTGPWDPASDASARVNGARLDAVITGWIALDSLSARPLEPSLFADTVRIGSVTTRRMAIVTSSHGGRFHAAPIRRLAAHSHLRGAVAGTIARDAIAHGYTGLVLDFESLEPADLPGLLAVVGAIADSAHRRGIPTIAVAIPAGDTAAYPARQLLGVADLALVMLYDQHWLGSPPGPVSGRDWVRRALAMRVAEAGADRLVAGLPLYGYRWRSGAPTEIVSYADARRVAAAERAPLTRDAASGTLRAERSGSWEMWVTDAALLRDLVADVERAGVRIVSLWRLGQEDPAIWESVIPDRGREAR